MVKKDTKIGCIACSVFKYELEGLRKQGRIGFPVNYLNSMLHMHPERLREKLDSTIEKIKKDNDRIILLYGVCHAYMSEQEKDPAVCRISSKNCAEMIVGPDLYKKLLNEGVFFMLPEWTHRWRTVFVEEIGFTETTGKEIMREMHNKLLYIDTGQIPIPFGSLREASDFLGLPWEILEIGPTHFLEAIKETIAKLDKTQ